jgi:hypothetical protein
MIVTWQVIEATTIGFTDPDGTARSNLMMRVAVMADGKQVSTIPVTVPTGTSPEAARSAVVAEVQRYQERDLDGHIEVASVLGMEGSV